MTTRTWMHRALAGALLGTFGGDAVGAGWEGAPTARGRDATDRIRTSAAAATLRYTDDTQLALALAEHLCDCLRVDPAGLAATIAEHFEPWRGYGGGMRRLVRAWRRGVDVDQAATSVFPEGSFGNGAAMRVAAVGVAWARMPQMLAEVAARQARVTHVHPLGVAGAVAQAHAVAVAALRGRFTASEVEDVAGATGVGPLEEGVADAADLARRWADDPSLELVTVAHLLGNEVVAQRSVPAAIWAAAAGECFEDAVTLAVGLGGDADTLAAMAGAVHGAAGGPHVVPWQDRFEDGPRGRSYALDVAGRLAAAAADA